MQISLMVKKQNMFVGQRECKKALIWSSVIAKICLCKGIVVRASLVLVSEAA
jgi:hypothetical protein